MKKINTEKTVGIRCAWELFGITGIQDFAIRLLEKNNFYVDRTKTTKAYQEMVGLKEEEQQEKPLPIYFKGVNIGTVDDEGDIVILDILEPVIIKYIETAVKECKNNFLKEEEKINLLKVWFKIEG